MPCCNGTNEVSLHSSALVMIGVYMEYPGNLAPSFLSITSLASQPVAPMVPSGVRFESPGRGPLSGGGDCYDWHLYGVSCKLGSLLFECN